MWVQRIKTLILWKSSRCSQVLIYHCTLHNTFYFYMTSRNWTFIKVSNKMLGIRHCGRMFAWHMKGPEFNPQYCQRWGKGVRDEKQG